MIYLKNKKGRLKIEEREYYKICFSSNSRSRDLPVLVPFSSFSSSFFFQLTFSPPHSKMSRIRELATKLPSIESNIPACP